MYFRLYLLQARVLRPFCKLKLAIEHAGSEYGRVTASIGAASWMPEQEGDVSSVIKAADEALYNAKSAGRNKVARA